jgi:hypothetical protein
MTAIMATVLSFLLWPSPQSALGAPSRAGDGPLYFWANLASPVKSSVPGFKNPPVIKPSSLLIFEDGSWLIEGLHWTGWGSPVAVAHGKSNADTDKPNVAEGKRIITPAKVVLYDPGVFRGRRVYRCIRMKLRPPARFQPSCLQRSGGIVALGPPGFGTPVGGGTAEKAVRHIDDFFTFGNLVWCQIDQINGASCGTDPAPPTHSASLDENGKVEICSVEKLEYPGGPGQPPLGCFQQWPDEKLPVLHEGEVTVVAGIRCTAEPMHLTCVKTSGHGKGTGFAINADLVAELGLAPKGAPPSTALLERASTRPACTKRALTRGLHRAGLPGYIDGHTFDCAGRFAYAGVIVDRNEVTVLFRAHGQNWRPADRGIYCENGSVPKVIFRPACETN